MGRAWAWIGMLVSMNVEVARNSLHKCKTCITANITWNKVMGPKNVRWRPNTLQHNATISSSIAFNHSRVRWTFGRWPSQCAFTHAHRMVVRMLVRLWFTIEMPLDLVPLPPLLFDVLIPKWRETYIYIFIYVALPVPLLSLSSLYL